jgi:hypothetical protein
VELATDAVRSLSAEANAAFLQEFTSAGGVLAAGVTG